MIGLCVGGDHEDSNAQHLIAFFLQEHGHHDIAVLQKIKDCHVAGFIIERDLARFEGIGLLLFNGPAVLIGDIEVNAAVLKTDIREGDTVVSL